MSRYRRDRTPDKAADEPRQRFYAIIRNASIERTVGERVYGLYDAVREKFSMDGDPLEWVIPGACALAVAQKAASGEYNVELSVLLKATGLKYGQVRVSVPQFFSRVRKWMEIAPIPPAARDMFSKSERYFQVSRNVFERYEQLFLSVFHDPIDPGMPRSSTIEKSVAARKKKTAQPKYVQPIDLYIFTWDLFVRIRRVATAIREDLVGSFHLLMCVVDLVCRNVLPLKRRDLFNADSTVIPAENPTAPEATETNVPVVEAEPKPEKHFSLLPYLCAHFDGIFVDCKTLYLKAFIPIVEKLIDSHELIADRTSLKGLLSPTDYETNLASINAAYEDLIRASCTVDERVLLVAHDTANPTVGGDPSNPIDVYDMLGDRRRVNPVQSRKLEYVDFQTPRPVANSSSVASPTPLTPTSSCTALERREAQESVKSPALNTAVDLVTRLTAMCTGRTNSPSPSLKTLLSAVYGKDVSSDFTRLSAACRELLVSAYLEQTDPTKMVEPFVRQRFVLAETWFFRLLEDILISERSRTPANLPRLQKLVDSTKFQKALFALSIEMILFSYNCAKMFPWPLEVLRIDPYDFVKIIEPVVHLVRLPSSLIRHLARIEESILEQIVWKSESPLWEEISQEEILPVREVCWPRNLEETPNVEGNNHHDAFAMSPAPPAHTGRKKVHGQTPLVPIVLSPDNDDHLAVNHQVPPSPKPTKSSATCLFFRKIYVLAAARLRDICCQLGFTADIERDYHVFQRMFTLFEHTLTHHTELFKDRHLDQILLCCAYVVGKLEQANGLDKSFHQIMHAYRFQPQAESRVYRSVLIGPKPVTVTHSHGTRRQAQAAALSQAGPEGEGDEIRADIISFYNTVFVRALGSFIAKFSPKKKGSGSAVPLSPVPKPLSAGGRRQVHPSGNVFVSPLKRELLPSPPPNDGRVLTFTFGVSGQQQEALLAASNSIPFPMPHRVPKYPLKRPDILPGEPEVKRIKLEPAQIMAAVNASQNNQSIFLVQQPTTSAASSITTATNTFIISTAPVVVEKAPLEIETAPEVVMEEIEPQTVVVEESIETSEVLTNGSLEEHVSLADVLFDARE